MVVVVLLSFFIRGLIILIHDMAHLIHNCERNLLVKCVVSSGMCFKNPINLSIFCSAFFFANFVNWRLWSDWMGFGVMGIQVSQLSSFFFFSEILSRFGLSHGLLLLHSPELRLSSVLMALFFPFNSSLKKSISLLSEEVWLWRLRKSSSRCPFSFASLASCCFISRRMACFSCILAASP